jgi:hypothetical protein
MELSETQQFRIEVLLTLQVALLGWIRPSVRKVGVGWSDKCINVRIFHDGEPDEDDVEAASCVETEIMASFPDHEVVVSAVRFDYPKPILNIEGISNWAYSRWEPSK